MIFSNNNKILVVFDYPGITIGVKVVLLDKNWSFGSTGKTLSITCFLVKYYETWFFVFGYGSVSLFYFI